MDTNANPTAAPLVTLVYATGTGNTAWAVGLLQGEFARAGWQTRKIEASGHQVPNPFFEPSRLLVLATPTLGFSAPASFLRWLKLLPEGKGTPVAIVAVCGGLWGKRGLVPGASGSVRRQITSRIRKRGYRLVSATEHSLPVNWVQLAPPPSEASRQQVSAAGEVKLHDLGHRLARGEFDPVLRLGSRWWGVIASVFRALARRLLGKLYSADTGCTSCGWCVATCPAQAIRLVRTLPAWNWNCDACNRCINGCPVSAIQVSWARLALHGAGQLVLTCAGVAVGLAASLPSGLGVYLAGTVLELVIAEPLLGWAQRRPRLQALLSRGPTSRWGRYLSAAR